MIKKILLTLGIILLGFINFSHGQAVGETSVVWEIPVGGQNTYNGITTEFKQNGNFQYSVLENIKALNNQYNTSCPFHSTTFWHDGKLYGNVNGTCTSGITRYWWQGYLPLCLTQGTGDKDFCMSDYSFEYYNIPLYYNPDSLQSYSFNKPHVYCFVYYDRGEKLCWYLSWDSGFGTGNLFETPITSNTDERLVLLSQSSPRGGGGGNNGGGFGSDDDLIVGTPLNSVTGAINYFETRYGWDETICYAGVDNLTALYGDPVSFQEGTGLSIFQVFSGLFGNEDLDKIYVWLNSWLINYDQWYERLEPLYLANYNSGTNQVDLYYTGFTFPFANNPVAIYFLTDNIYNNSTYKTQGSEIVSYCNLKINNGIFDEIIDQSVKNNINDQIELSNINKGLNSDGSRREFDNVGAFLTSGTDLAFSGNTTVKNTLKNFFDDIDQALSVIDINTSNRILPTWFVTAFLFVVLFKVLRKR